MHIYLVRHGLTEWNACHRFLGQKDIPLNDEGRIQSEKLAKRLEDTCFSVVYSSPLQRAYETTRIIARGREWNIVQDNRLIELNIGSLEGKTFSTLTESEQEAVAKWYKDPEMYRLPEGENLSELQKRAWDFIEEIGGGNSEEKVLVVSHAFTVGMILCKALRRPIKDFLRFRQDPTAVNILSYGKKGINLISLNDTSHLEPCSADK